MVHLVCKCNRKWVWITTESPEGKGGRLRGVEGEFVKLFLRFFWIKHSPRNTSTASAATPPPTIPAIVAVERFVDELEPVRLADGLELARLADGLELARARSIV